MADYLITGKKGNGKGIFAVGVIRDALAAGKRIATNIDIHLEKLIDVRSKASLIRVPDCPTREILDALGRGQDGVVEEDNGVLVLDEASKFLNSRSWSDKGRLAVLDWLVHSRKLGWDVYMITQGPEQIDKQLRTSLLEYWVLVKRTNKWPIPLVTPVIQMLTGYRVCFPKIHIGTIRHGFDVHGLIVDRKWYRGEPLYEAYDTQQIFMDSDQAGAICMHSVLSPWHTAGRYLPAIPSLWERLFPVLMMPVVLLAWVVLSMSPRLRQLYAAHR